MNPMNKQREISRRAELIRTEIAKLRKANPQLSHVAAWRKVLAAKPHLFEDQTTRASASNDTIEAGKCMIRAQVASDIREAVKGLQQAQPGLSFVEAWELARKERPALFESAKRIESGNWGPAPRASLVHAVKKPAVRSKPKDGDDREVYLVMAGSQVVDIKLE